jgi:hypothetical protein
MAQKPYRFSKKAGRYIPNNLSGNREFYQELLVTIEPLADFDANSTYGKHIMKKTISDLRKYKCIIEQYNRYKNILSHEQRDLHAIIAENNQLHLIRRENAINKRAFEIVEEENPIIAFIKKWTLLSSVVLALLAYLVLNRFQIVLFVFFGFWLTFNVLSSYILNLKKKSNLNRAENELLKIDFTKDLLTIESNKHNEILLTKVKIANCKEELKILENEIRIKVQGLLNEEKLNFILSEHFYNSTDWKLIRGQALLKFEKVCVYCGSFENLSVDHILPRSKFPEKALELSNTQILCIKCNSSKGNKIFKR